MHELRTIASRDASSQEDPNDLVRDLVTLSSSKITTSAISFGDDDRTIVSPQNHNIQDTRNLGSVKKNRDRSSKMAPVDKIQNDERYLCCVPGCSRGFVNQAELEIHVAMYHSSGDEDKLSEWIQDNTMAVDQIEHVQNQSQWENRYAGEIIDAVESQTTVPNFLEGDQTVKPIPITTAALQALNSSTPDAITRSMDDLSITNSFAKHSSLSLTSVGTTYSVLDDIEDLPISEVGDQSSDTIRLPVQMLLQLWTKMVLDFSNRKSTNLRQNTSYAGSATGQYGVQNGLDTYSKPSSLFSGSMASRKRKPSNDEDDDDSGRKNKMRNKPGQSSTDNKALGCPFNKYDNYIYGGDSSNQTYLVCATWHDVKTAYFKQHLLRTHCIAEFVCDRCGTDYKNQGTLRAHRRQDPPCELKELDSQKIMPELQEELGLRGRNVVGIDRVSYWYKVYDTVFGNEARINRPIEPYYEGPSHEILHRFMHFSERRLPEVIRRSRQMLNLSTEAYSEQDTQLVRTILQEASHTFMADLRESPALSLKDIKQQNSSTTIEVDEGEQTIVVKKEPARRERYLLPNEEEHAFKLAQPQSNVDLPINTSMAPPPQPRPQDTYVATNLPTRSLNRPTSETPHALGFLPPQQRPQPPQMPGYDLQLWPNQEFDHWGDFDATIEDQDLYGAGTMSQNDLDGFHMVEDPSKDNHHPN